MFKNKITFLIVSAMTFYNSFSAFAAISSECFIATEGNRTVVQEGACDQRHSSCSTFKIAISLMGFNEKILIDETNPKLPFTDKKGNEALPEWEEDQDPITWIKSGCVWYSRFITEKLGMSKLKDYTAKFEYGNQDLSGDKGKNNGLTHAWLSSSLQISPKEQVNFIQKLLSGKLTPIVSVRAQEFTRKILFRETLSNGWKLYGKTGTGVTIKHDDSCKDKNCNKAALSIGWFVGWIEKGDRKIVFAYYLECEKKDGHPAGKLAMERACERLVTLTK